MITCIVTFVGAMVIVNELVYMMGCATSTVNDYNCITQKDTQLSQTFSEGHIFLLLYATVASLCILGSVN